MSLLVVAPGLYSLPVDLGRPGSRSLGMPLGGAADRAAHALANALVGNPPGAVALELTLAGPALTADADTACVVFGAPFELAILGRAAPVAGMTFTLRRGETLHVGGTPTGVRGTLAVRGGFECPAVLGSRSALAPVRAGETLACGPSTTAGRALPFAIAPGPFGDGDVTLRAMLGPQHDWFDADEFWRRVFTVTGASNRMGLRLSGEPLARRPGELVSEPVAPGAVQVANDGLPIVLGVDGQTIGGYPKPAHVVRADLDMLARLRPGSRVRFRRVTPEEAEAAARERSATLADWLRRLRLGGA